MPRRFPSAPIGCALLLAAAIAGAPAPAAADPAGFAFLEIPAGARASALGGAFSSMAEGVEAAYANPAGLESVKGVELAATHYEYFEQLRHDQFAIALRGLGGAFSGSIRALYSQPIDERDELGNLTGTFGSHDLEFGLGYGRRIAEGLSFGGMAKLVRERIARSAAMTWGFDLGTAWEPRPGGGLRLGAALQNVGPAAHYAFGDDQGGPVPLPSALQTGVSYRWDAGPRLAIRGALEGRLTRGRSGVGMVGAELEAPGTGATLRAGFRMNDDSAGISAGLGYAVGALRLDYAWVPYRFDLGDTHRFSLNARF
jgi:hypothetical protein